ncbi:MAG: hypothetical protein JWM20_276 [Patescibacteria group bacterium]|nr:hypothetical protein [Patescibacteria group bacterium]
MRSHLRVSQLTPLDTTFFLRMFYILWNAALTAILCLSTTHERLPVPPLEHYMIYVCACIGITAVSYLLGIKVKLSPTLGFIEPSSEIKTKTNFWLYPFSLLGQMTPVWMLLFGTPVAVLILISAIYLSGRTIKVTIFQ